MVTPLANYQSTKLASLSIALGGADKILDSERDRRMSVCIQEKNV